MADLTGIGAAATAARDILGMFFPDKTEEEKAKMAQAFAVIQGQLDTNKAEAGSGSVFVGGWRPAIGWVCAVALLCQYVARPMLMWAGLVTGHSWPPLPGIDDNLWELMLGMLGLGGLRTFEKARGVAK
jgi:hypothetical protein